MKSALALGCLRKRHATPSSSMLLCYSKTQLKSWFVEGHMILLQLLKSKGVTNNKHESLRVPSPKNWNNSNLKEHLIFYFCSRQLNHQIKRANFWMLPTEINDDVFLLVNESLVLSTHLTSSLSCWNWHRHAETHCKLHQNPGITAFGIDKKKTCQLLGFVKLF